MNRKIFSLVILLSFVSFSYSQKRTALLAYQTDSKIIYGICFTLNGEALAIADNNTIKVYSTNSKELIAEFKNGHSDQIMAIDISKDSTLLVSGGKDSTINIWDFSTKSILQTLKYQKGKVTSLKLSPDGKYLLYGCTDNIVYLYDLKFKKVIKEFTEHGGVVTSVIFSHDGKQIFSASADRTINIYAVKDFKLLKSLKQHRSWVRDIAVSKDGTKLISCGDDGRTIVWNIANIQDVKIIEKHFVLFNWILSVDFNADNSSYIYGGMNGRVKITSSIVNYKIRIKKPVNKILFKPNEGYYLKAAIATRGKGVILIDSKNIKYETD